MCSILDVYMPGNWNLLTSGVQQHMLTTKLLSYPLPRIKIKSVEQSQLPQFLLIAALVETQNS